MKEMPYVRAGQSVGLLGGSFDPAHDGHVMITKAALQRFQLDWAWWMLTPHNPLKERGPAPLGRRKAAAENIMIHPRVSVTHIERELRTLYTAETLRALKQKAPGVRFVWLMGADNLVQFHKWRDWEWIMENVPVGVIARPGDRISARMSKAAKRFRHAKLGGRQSMLLARRTAPSWCMINCAMSSSSSSAIRARGGWDTKP